jgi:hypothetical protein
MDFRVQTVASAQLFLEGIAKCEVDCLLLTFISAEFQESIFSGD